MSRMTGAIIGGGLAQIAPGIKEGEAYQRAIEEQKNRLARRTKLEAQADATTDASSSSGAAGFDTLLGLDPNLIQNFVSDPHYQVMPMDPAAPKGDTPAGQAPPAAAMDPSAPMGLAPSAGAVQAPPDPSVTTADGDPTQIEPDGDPDDMPQGGTGPFAGGPGRNAFRVSGGGGRGLDPARGLPATPGPMMPGKGGLAATPAPSGMAPGKPMDPKAISTNVVLNNLQNGGVVAKLDGDYRSLLDEFKRAAATATTLAQKANLYAIYKPRFDAVRGQVMEMAQHAAIYKSMQVTNGAMQRVAAGDVQGAMDYGKANGVDLGWLKGSKIVQDKDGNAVQVFPDGHQIPLEVSMAMVESGNMPADKLLGVIRSMAGYRYRLQGMQDGANARRYSADQTNEGVHYKADQSNEGVHYKTDNPPPKAAPQDPTAMKIAKRIGELQAKQKGQGLSDDEKGELAAYLTAKTKGGKGLAAAVPAPAAPAAQAPTIPKAKAGSFSN